MKWIFFLSGKNFLSQKRTFLKLFRKFSQKLSHIKSTACMRYVVSLFLPFYQWKRKKILRFSFSFSGRVVKCIIDSFNAGSTIVNKFSIVVDVSVEFETKNIFKIESFWCVGKKIIREKATSIPFELIDFAWILRKIRKLRIKEKYLKKIKNIKNCQSTLGIFYLLKSS